MQASSTFKARPGMDPDGRFNPLLLRMRRTWPDAWPADTGGATALEFALIAPILLLMLGGIIDYGNYFATAHAIQQTVNDAARVAIAGTTADERLQLAQEAADRDLADYAFLTPGRARLSIDEGGDNLVVRLVYAPDGGSFELMPLAPGLPATVSRSAAIVRGGY